MQRQRIPLKAGGRMNRKIPMRQCIGCRQMKNKKELMRVLRTSEGEIKLDLTGKQNGRGAYLCYDSMCLQKAMKNKALERSLHMPVSEEVYASLKRELETIERT